MTSGQAKRTCGCRSAVSQVEGGVLKGAGERHAYRVCSCLIRDWLLVAWGELDDAEVLPGQGAQAQGSKTLVWTEECCLVGLTSIRLPCTL